MNTPEAFRVSIVANATSTKTKDGDAPEIIRNIRDGEKRQAVETIRETFSRVLAEKGDLKAAKRAVDPLKKQLPGVLWSGRFSSREKPAAEKLLAHSGLLCADLDNLDKRIPQVRAKLATSPHLFALFTSPTGNGLKAVFRVSADVKRHYASFRAVEKHVLDLTGETIDGACKDVARLCFVSYAPDALLKQDAVELPPLDVLSPMPSLSEFQQLAKDPHREGLPPQDCEPAAPAIRLHPSSASYALHPAPCALRSTSYITSSNSVLESIQGEREAMMLLSKKHGGLPRLYDLLVGYRFSAVAGARNDFIVQAAPFLFRAVARAVAFDLLLAFYDCNRALFKDPREQHAREAEAMLRSVEDTYRSELGPSEKDVYLALEPSDRDAFRVCRGLALLPEPEREPLTFFLSYEHCAARLGNSSTQASRTLKKLVRYGIVRLLEPGTRRARGIPGKASVWRWELDSQHEQEEAIL